MPKKGVSAISGNVSPVVGEKNTYHVSDWYPDTPTSERDLKAVTWELFRKRSNGKFTTTHVRKKGDSSFTFGEASLGHTYRLEGYLHEPEGGGLIITPKQNKIPQICKTELYYTDGTKGSKFSFMEKLRAKAYCVNMFNKEVLFTLWEDDAKGAGHHANNTAIETQKSRVDENGLAVAEFMLTKALMRKAMKGEANARELEFYVTVEYYKHNKHATENVEVENPYAQYYNPKPYQPPVIPKAKGSPAEQKPASQKEEKGIVDTAIDKMKELWDWGESKGTATKEKSPTILRPEGRSAVVVREVKREEEKEEEICVCKQYDLVWGNKIGCNERKKVIEVAKNLDVNPNWLMTVIAIETIESFNPAIQNSYGYTGLIQIGKDAADTIGTTIDSLKKMTFVEQMDYVQKHLMSQKDKYKTLTDLYLAVLYPKACGNGSEKDYVILHGAAYRNNPFFFKEEGEWEYKIIDKNGKKIKKVVPTDPNGNTYVWEITMVAQEKYTKGLSIKEKKFNCGILKQQNKNISKCADDFSQCIEYDDVVENPRINDQSNNVNKNRFHRAIRINKAHPKGYFHTGTDILASLNTPLKSMLCGEVMEAYDTGGDLGIIVTIKSKDKDGNFIWIRYCHLNSLYTKKGQKIRHGSFIGLSGNTGNAKSILPQYYHVHIEASKDGIFYKGKNRVDPEQFMKTKFDESIQGNPIKKQNQ